MANDTKKKKKADPIEDHSFKSYFGFGSKATPEAKQQKAEQELLNAHQKAKYALDRLEENVKDLEATNNPEAGEHRRKFEVVRQKYLGGATVEVLSSVESACWLGLEHTSNKVADGLLAEVEKLRTSKDFTNKKCNELKAAYDKGKKDDYDAFCRVTRYELKNLKEQKARWNQISNQVKGFLDTANEMGRILNTIPGKEALVEESKRAQTLWDDSDKAAGDRRDYNTAADLGLELMALQRKLSADFDATMQGNLQLGAFVVEPRNQANGMIGNFQSVATTRLYRAFSGAASLQNAQRLVGVFDAIANTQDKTQLTQALIDLGQVKLDWQRFEIAADKWVKDKGERTRSKQQARTLLELAGTTSSDHVIALQKEVKAYLEALERAEGMTGNTIASKVLAGEAGATAEEGFAPNEGTARKLFEEERQQALASQHKALAEKNKNGPEAKLTSAMAVVYENTPLAETLLKAEKLKSAAAKTGTKLPNDFSLAHATALNLYTNQVECDKMQCLLLDIEKPTQKVLNEKEVEAFNKVIELAKEGLAKLPPFTGNTKRGETAWKGADEQYQVNKVFTIKSFWSTAFGTGAFGGTYQITIIPNAQKAGGRQVDAFSDHHKESEVLFPPGTTFKVIARTGNVSTGFQITVQEQ